MSGIYNESEQEMQCHKDDVRKLKEHSSPASCSTGFLFPVETVKKDSPKLAWMKKHGIRTKYRRDLHASFPRWEAYVGEYETAIQTVINAHDDPDLSTSMAIGMTEQEAINQLASNRRINLW